MSTAPAKLPRLNVGLADYVGSIDLVLCDVWGVVHNGARRHDGAVDALSRFRRSGGTVILVTNAPAPKAQVQRRMDRLGVPRDAYDDIATSGDVTVEMMVAAGSPPVFAIGPDGETGLFEECARIGARRPDRVGVAEAALAICIGLDDRRNRPDEYDGDLRIMRDHRLELICANPDIVVEVGETLVYCAGAIAERYAAIGGRVLQAGKPFPAIYERAFAMAATARGRATEPARVLAIGDAMATDVKGAANQGIASLMVTGGIHRAAIHGAEAGAAIDHAAFRQFLDDFQILPAAAVPLLVWRA